MFLELANQCQDGEIDFIPGESYIKGNCSQNCSCNEVRYVGHVELCVPLCPSIPVKCLWGTIPEFYHEDIYGSGCSCRKWRCVKGLPNTCLFYQYNVKKGLLPKTLLEEPYYQKSYLHGMNMD